MTLVRIKSVNASDVTDDQVVDVATLASVINDCFKASRDLRYRASWRGSFLSAGITLRGQLNTLVGEIFDQGSVELLEANKKIKKLNLDLKQTLAVIEKAADTIEQLGDLVGQLTELIDIAGLLP